MTDLSETKAVATSPAIWRWPQGLALLVAATGLAAWLDPRVSLTSLAMVYLLAVVVAAYRMDWPSAVGTAVAAVTALNFFFVPPRWTFEVESRDHLIALAAMLAVALVISHLARNLRQEALLARLSEQRARQLHALSVALSEAARPDEVQHLGQAALAQAFAGPVHLVLADSARDTWPAQARDGLDRCMQDRAVLGPGTGRWPGLGGWFLPLLDGHQALGAAFVQPALAGDDDGRAHASAVVALLAQALARMAAAGAELAARAEAERQQMLNTFLAAISHDLRTPLAAIVGAGSSLQAQWERMPADARTRLLGTVVSEATRLGRLADNTLQLVRLSLSPGDPQLGWESPEELVGAAVARQRALHPDRTIATGVEAGLPLVRVDAVLIDQLLANLLDNALRYSAGPVQVRAERTGDQLQLWVDDQGPGLDPLRMATLFHPFSQGDGSGIHGAGLGLAVCQAIARLHRAELLLQPGPSGGFSAGLRLAVPTQPGLADPSLEEPA